MTGLPPPTQSILRVHFEVDGLYFAEATRQSKALPEFEAAYEVLRAKTIELNRNISEVEARYAGDSAAAYDQTESDVISLVDGVFVELEKAALPLGGLSAAIQTLSAACLEAHINGRAAETLPGAVYKEFERASLGGKWVLYPKLRNLCGLEPGEAIIRNIQKLVKRRNALAHPKPQMVDQNKGFETPEFLERMHLTGEAAREAIAWTEAAVRTLANAEGRPSPDWLEDSLWSLFRHAWEPVS